MAHARRIAAMSAPRASRTLTLFLPPFLLLLGQALGLSLDGVRLLQFKYAVLSDPLAALRDWRFDDYSPCLWNGVMCAGGFPDSSSSRVIGLHLPDSELVGSIPPELGLIEHLRQVELSGNFLNGTLPPSVFSALELRVLSLADNKISGEVPDIASGRGNALRVLNLSDNALVGAIPSGVALLPDLTVVSLANNYLSGEVPAGSFRGVQHLDLRSNLINGSLPPDLAGQSLHYLDLSGNQIGGAIPPEWSLRFPANATINLSSNNLTGEIPQGGVFASQTTAAYAGNSKLCGKPLNSLCTISSPLSAPPNSTTSTASVPPAFAAMPLSPAGKAPAAGRRAIEIAIGHAVGIALLIAVVFFVYKVKKKKNRVQQQQQQQQINGIGAVGRNEQPSAPPKAAGCLDMRPCCLRRKGDHEEDDSEGTWSASSGAEAEEKAVLGEGSGRSPQQKATLVTVDGEADLELEMLLKASAHVLGASGSSIVYKAVLANGTALAVRRIGDCSTIDKLKDFDVQVRGIAKLRHPNLLRLRGFYWSPDEKLLIHDLATNGSLANITFTTNLGPWPFLVSWDSRLRIARGVARGLAYLHKKKAVHGNLKPSNILLDADMEPKIADFGLDRLMSDGGYRPGTSGRLFDSKRSVPSRTSLPEQSPRSAGTSPCGSSSASALAAAAAAAAAVYQAPEYLKNLKPSAKCDVYSFGVVLLELLTGRVLSEVELGEWSSGFVAEERSRVVRMADPSVREELEGSEEALLSCFKLGFACCAVAPQRRPGMKEAVQVLDKLPSPSSSSLDLLQSIEFYN